MIRAYITDNWMGATVGISIVHEFEREPGQPPLRRVLQLGSSEDGVMRQEWKEIDYTEGLNPTLVLGHDQAHAILAALTSHYQGVDDARLLRQDYTAERSRVDKLIDAVSDIARRATGERTIHD